MSHFVGIVFGSDIDLKLAPYDEQLEVEAYIDKTPEELIEWVNKEIAYMRDYIKKYSESEDKYYKNRVEHMLEDLQLYNNFESKEDYDRYIRKYFTLDDEGNSITTYNPQSKWDWYIEGGRWSGEILHAGSYDTNSARKEELTQIDTPYCFVDLDGNWHEQGSMGWWDMSYGDKPEEEWEKEFREYLESIPENTLITVIDFHI